jgi:hypothetical protein
MEINKAWHEKHRMPKNATLDQRVEWHLAHARACSCLEMPATIKAELAKRKIKIPKAD